MNEFAQTLYTELAEELELIHDLGDLPVRRLTTAVNATAATIKKLRAHLAEMPPANDQEEIDLFKRWKPKFAAEQYFALEKFTIETNRPLTDPALLRAYYEQELAVVNRFFTQHEFLYQYFKFGFTELDHLLFLRTNITAADFLLITADLDPAFSTKGDNLCAKFIACEKLRDYLVLELNPAAEPIRPLKTLRWTGDKMNLAELAYGIYDTAQVNNGDIDIKDIIAWLEETLNVSLNRHYRMFTEMKNRKSVSPTRFLDHMGAMVRRHLVDADKFNPQSPKPVSGSGKKT